MTNPPKTPLERKEGSMVQETTHQVWQRWHCRAPGLGEESQDVTQSGHSSPFAPPSHFFSSSRTSAERFKSSFVCNFVETKATISCPSACVSNPKAKCCAKGAAQQTGDWNAVPGCRAVRGAYRWRQDNRNASCCLPEICFYKRASVAKRLLWFFIPTSFVNNITDKQTAAFQGPLI